jgi:hypothetical protein
MGILAAIVALLGSGPPAAQATDVVRVEQDWELVVSTPDAASDAPQITTSISPTGSVESLHAVFVLNHRTLPRYAAGGLQLQLWDGETSVSEHTSYKTAVLAQPSETVTWTQSVEVRDGTLLFAISGGTSVTWGEFGRSGHFYVATPTMLANLNGYNTDVSIRNSGVGFADNRVQSLAIKKIRYYTSAGQVLEDAEPKVIHSQN